MNRRRPLFALLAAAAVSLGTVVLAAVPAQAADAPWWQANNHITCNSDPGGSHFYNGPSAGAKYDHYFPKPGAELPASFLNNWVPQGLGCWTNWDGAGHDLRLVSGYHDGGSSALIGLVVNGGATHVATLPASHVGGVAKVGNWLFVSGADSGGYPVVDRYSVSEARTALQRGSFLTPVHRAVITVGGKTAATSNGLYFRSSFLGAYGSSTLFIGMFDDQHRNRMYQYTVRSNGDLVRVGSADNWTQVPLKSQGLAVTANHFIFSTSSGNDNPGNVYVIRRGYKLLDTAVAHSDLYCFHSPSMNEGATILGANLYLVFESGSYEYLPKNPRNPIGRLHYASVSALESIT